MSFAAILAAFISAFLFINHACASVGGYIGPTETTRLVNVLKKSLGTESDEVHTYYHGIVGLKLFNEQIDAALSKKLCDRLQKEFKHDGTAEVAFYSLSMWSLLGCSGKLHSEATLKTLRTIVETDQSPIAEIRYAAEALKLAGQTVPNAAKVAQALQSKLKEDDSLQSIGHALHAATFLGNSGKFAHDRIEDVVVQADEVDGKLLQWEGGLTTTSLLITGLLRLPGAKPLTQSQSDKLSTYLLTRKTVQTARGVVALVEATNALSASSVAPISVSIVGPPYVTTDKPDLKVRISDLLGRPLKPAPSPIVAQSATRLTDDVVVLSKQPLTPGSTPTEFVLPLRLEPGQYKIELTAGSHSATLTIRIMGPVTLQTFEIGLTDADDTTLPKLTKLHPPNKLPSIWQADSSHHLVAKFSLSRPVHQAFLRLFTYKKEIIFVAEQDSSKVYKIDINLLSEIAHSGTFQMELILGDSVMSNPMRWIIGTVAVNLGIPEPPKKQARVPKPEIQHLFRPAEKRPPEVVSLVFTALTAAPLLLLLVLWLKIGINFGNFTVTAVPFHVGFGAILALFTCFWLALDMFKTCAWLIPIGSFTFLSGQKLLSNIARHKKTEKAEK